MKVTFITPPILIGNRATERVAGCTYSLYPVPNIYELTVAALVRAHDFDINYVESILNNWKKEEFVEFLKNDDSDAYAIWTVNLGKDNDIEAHKIIREIKKDVPLIFQGPCPTQFPDKMLIDKNTFVLRGEPEYTMIELLKAFEKKSLKESLPKIKGLSYKAGAKKNVHNNEREIIKNLDDLPFPARDLVDKKHFYNPKLKAMPYTAMATSRNCPGKCIYCVPSSLTFARELEYKRHHKKKPPIRLRSEKSVIKEIRALVKQGYKAISFQDDNFIWTATRLRLIAEELKKYNIAWGCQSRADEINEEIAKILSDTECKYVDMGVESFDQEILDDIKKGITAEKSIAAIKILQKYNVPVKLNILFGSSPKESRKSIEKTLEVLKEIDADQVMFSLTSPFPGTEYYEIAKKNKLFINGDYIPVDVQKKSIINLPNLSGAELEKILFWANIKFFLNPKFILKNIFKFRSPKQFFIALRGIFRKLFA